MESKFIESIKNEIKRYPDKRPLEMDLPPTFLEDILPYVTCLEDIPEDRMRWAGKYFILVVADYNHQLKKYEKKTYKFKQNQMGGRLIKKDLKIMHEYKMMIERNSGIRELAEGLYLYPANIDSTLKKAHDSARKLMKDVNYGHFNIVSKDKYYKGLSPSKTAIRDFLYEMKEEHSLKCTDLQFNDLLSQI